jgi:hypothetical protein
VSVLAGPMASITIAHGHRDVALEGGESLDADDLAALRAALAIVLPRLPGVLRAAVYPLARGEAIVRLITARGWIPVVIGCSDWSDPPSMVARLEAGMAGVGSPAGQSR